MQASPPIVTVQPHLRLGGSERQTVLLANALARRGQRSIVIVFDRVGALVDELDPAVEVISLGLESHALVPEVARRLNRELAKLPPSLIVFKLWSALLVGSLVDGRHPDHRFVFAEDLDPGQHASHIRLGRLKQALIRRIFRSRKIVTANTFAVADSMVRQYGLVRRPVVVSSAIDLTLLARSCRRPDLLDRSFPRPLTVVSVGSLTERKGLRVTREALELLNRPVRWLIVGEGELASEISTKWTSSNVQYVLVGGDPYPFDYMRGADLLIHSSHSEALGLVLLEALAVGTPVVASATIGASEIAARLDLPEGALTLFPVGDAGALAALVGRHIAGKSVPFPPDPSVLIQPYLIDGTVDSWLHVAAEAFR